MAITYDYNTTMSSLGYLYRATSGGTVFSPNYATTSVFDYFDDSAVVGDALYFAKGTNNARLSDFEFNVGTSLVASSITLIWEYWKRDIGWFEIPDLIDDTNNFTITGVNRVKFPLLWSPTFLTVNGVSRHWIRCRITAVSGITEGGANQTDEVKTSNGRVTITGATDVDPCSFTMVYNWMKANYPYVGISFRNGNSFNFTKIAINIASRLKTSGEVIEIGQDCYDNAAAGATYLNYLESGKKVNDRGYAGSTFIVYGTNNSGVINCTGSAMILYGTTFRTGKFGSDHNRYPGYFTLRGEILDCTFELATRMPSSSSSSVKKCKFTGSLVIASSTIYNYDDNFYFCTGYSLFYIYRTGWTLDGFDWGYSASSFKLCYLYQGSDRVSPVWLFKNIRTTLPTGFGSVRAIRCGSTNSIQALTSVKFYDVSAGIYTDYTAEAEDTNLNDVPLTGDVGDYYLFGCASGVSSSHSIKAYLSAQSNDYEYIWEYYNAGSWHEVGDDWIWDGSYNFTVSGNIHIAVPSNMSYLTIDGVNTKWVRLRIVTKGVDMPVANQIRWCRHSGVSRWSLQEKYSFNLKVVNETGTPINNAQVTATYTAGDEAFDVTTNVDGDIPEQLLFKKEYKFSPLEEPVTTIKEILYTTFDLRIEVAGYGLYKVENLDIGNEMSWVVKLGGGEATIIYDSTLNDSVIY